MFRLDLTYLRIRCEIPGNLLAFLARYTSKLNKFIGPSQKLIRDVSEKLVVYLDFAYNTLKNDLPKGTSILFFDFNVCPNSR